MSALRRVLVIDDHSLIATTLTGVLRARGYDARVCAVRSDEEILADVRDFQPAVVLLDLALGKGRSSVGLIQPLRRAGAGVVMLTGTTDPVRLAECIEAGAAGVLSKDAGVDDVAVAVETVSAGGTLVPEAQREALLAQLQRHRDAREEHLADFRRLTPREEEVLAALVKGKAAQTIADETVTSIRTVRNHIQSILDKLHVGSQLAAVVRAKDVRWRPGRQRDQRS